MTPPTEKPFEPTPEQVEEAGRMLSGLSKVVWNAFPDSKEPWIYAAKRHLAELSTLRSQLDALKAEVVRKDEALKRILEINNEGDYSHPPSNVLETAEIASKALAPAKVSRP